MVASVPGSAIPKTSCGNQGKRTFSLAGWVRLGNLSPEHGGGSFLKENQDTSAGKGGLEAG